LGNDMSKSTRIAAVAGLLCLQLAATGFTAPARPTPARFSAPASPRLAALERAVASGDHAAVAEFWNGIAARGTPLVEPIPGNDREVLVTFLWRAAPGTTGVLVMSPVRTTRDLSEGAMTRLAETDVWFRTYQLRADLRFTYSLVPNPRPGTTLQNADAVNDPLNPRRFTLPPNPELPGESTDGPSMVELPAAPREEWTIPDAGVPKGRVEVHHLKSAAMGDERRLWVYTPPGYDPHAATPYPLVVCFDGTLYIYPVPGPTILDNLLAAHKVPPMVLVSVEPGPGRTAELANHPPIVKLIADEVVPWARKAYRVTSDPAETILCGASAGGLAAAFVAFNRPDVIGNVLAQSGAFWRGFDGDIVHHEWLTEQYKTRPRLPIRFYMNGGALEQIPTAYDGPNLPTAAEHLLSVLTAKGYPVAAYREVPGAHEPLSWRSSLADGLIFLTSSWERRTATR
jgi:enterochelin esterase-like enzyme